MRTVTCISILLGFTGLILTSLINIILILYFVVALAVLLQHINLPEVTIAFDGSVYEKHPKFRIHIADLLAKLVPTTKVRLR